MADLQFLWGDFPKVAPHIFLHDFLRYTIGAGGLFLIVNCLLRPVLKGRQIRSTRPHWRQLISEILASLRTVLIFSLIGLAIWATDEIGIARFYDSADELGWAWFWISLIILIVAHDAWFYWTHRIMHHPRLFRRFHRLHHRSHNPTPFTSYAFDWRESVVNGVFMLLIGWVMPISFFAMFLFTAHMMLRNAMAHCGYELFPRTKDGAPFFDWITTVTHHDLHHAEAGWNYGFYFTFWDRLMGTEHPKYHERFAAAVRKDRTASINQPAPATGLARSLVLGAGLVFTGAAVTAAKAYAEPRSDLAVISDDWATPGYGAVVRLGPCAEAPQSLCGTLVWAWDERDLVEDSLGNPMIWGFAYHQSAWRGGTLRNPEDGRRYSGTITLVDGDRLELQGCAARIFCRRQTWRRLSSLPHIEDQF